MISVDIGFELPLNGAILKINQYELLKLNDRAFFQIELGSSEIAFIVVFQGGVEVNTATRGLDQSASMLHLLRPSETGHITSRSNCTIICIVEVAISGEFSDSYLRQVNDAVISSNELNFKMSNLLKPLILNGMNYENTQWSDALLRSSMGVAVLSSLRSLFIEKQTVKASQRERLIRRVELFIEKNYSNSNLLIDEIANISGLTSRHLNRIFVKERNMTVKAALLGHRMKEARRCLVECSDTSVKEIAYSCGFSSPSYFSVCYKRAYGISPAAVEKAEG